MQRKLADDELSGSSRQKLMAADAGLHKEPEPEDDEEIAAQLARSPFAALPGKRTLVDKPIASIPSAAPGRRNLAERLPTDRSPEPALPLPELSLSFNDELEASTFTGLRTRALHEVVAVLAAMPGGRGLMRAALTAARRATSSPIQERASLTRRSAPPDPSGRAMWQVAERRAATLYRQAAQGEQRLEDPVIELALEKIGRGNTLPAEVRITMERELGVPLGRVRIHTDSLAAEAARAVCAEAFTVGEDIFFAKNAFAPDTERGSKLLVHELMHVIQAWQQRVGSSATGLRASDPHEHLEQEAHAVAERVGNRRGAQSEHTPVPGQPPRILGPVGLPQPTTTASPHTLYRRPDQIAIPNQTTPKRVRGDRTSKKIVRVAWTMDDGPTKVTNAMKEKLGNIPTTWYVMRNQIEEGGKAKENLAKLKKLQENGSEIAIHGLHKTKAHLAWFPSATKECYPSIEAALADLDTFNNQLKAAGIKAKFVRLPGGEVSEIANLLSKLGLKDKNKRGQVARKIIKQENVTNDGDAAVQAKHDWDKFIAKISRLGLHNWGGAGADKPEVSAQSWEAESSGTGLTDDVTSSHGGKVKDAGKDRGKFEQLVDSVQEGHPRSIVVLAHDTAPKDNQGNITEVGNDIARMESYAKDKKVRIEYYTMSELYKLTRGKAP